MSERVERRLVEILDDPVVSPYGNAIPGLSQLGASHADVPEASKTTLRQAAEGEPADNGVAVSGHGPAEKVWTVQRLAESIQVEPEVLAQLLDVGLQPGAQVSVSGTSEAYAMLGVHQDDGLLEVELPLEIAQHIFVQ